GCELRYQQRAACRDRRAGAHLCGRHPADRQSAGGGRSGSARERQAAGAEFTEPRLAYHHVAQRFGRTAALALCPRAGAHCAENRRRGTIEWPDGETAPTKYWLSNI